mgnify:CR=1 FL=1
MMKIHIINGPNLNLLGKREPEIYGAKTFEDYYEDLKVAFPDVVFSYMQSNVEGELITSLQEFGYEVDGIILNAGAYTHTSVGLGVAVSAVKAPVLEVHISNVYSRESYRHQSHLTGKCVGVISGLGLDGYRLAVDFFTHNK